MEKLYPCIKGPLNGQQLWLSDPFTAWFTLHGQTGRYAFGRWQVKK